MNNFITYTALITKALWLGKLPLYIAFWWFGILGTIALGFLFTLIFSAEDDPSIIEIFLVAIVSIGYQILISIGIWRSADAYQGDKGYAVAARLTVVLYAGFGMIMLGNVLLMIPLLVTVILNPPFIK
jgi:hypothetical protein